MLCEHTTTRFPVRKDRSSATPVQVRCRRLARVRASVPFGANALDFCYCRECAAKRATDVLDSRGKVVRVAELPADMLPTPQPRDSMGRFLSVGGSHATN